MMENRLTPEEVRQNLREIQDRIAAAARASGREPGEVQLMAVTKTVPPELINAAWEEGVRLFGENRVQELLEKADRYAFGPEQIHFIGTLQTNKVRQLMGRVSCIQSVNSLHLAREIQKRAEAQGIVLDVLLEINIGGEDSKTGMDFGQLDEILENIASFSALQVKGLMCIPPFGEDPLETERYFERMHKIFVDIKDKKIDNISMETLSMGMTGDYELAIRQGSNLVRVGTGIFGRRKY
ncbi:MAG: YggS family pyridoxal phosphate-dependent enzyme [Angelakisella sp.]|jgi:pyridoxal phosphate enzyme (YggS family)|nr:YggS family pyridoxal phosphate-dependent enzyme [Angelakisella sp.]